MKKKKSPAKTNPKLSLMWLLLIPNNFVYVVRMILMNRGQKCCGRKTTFPEFGLSIFKCVAFLWISEVKHMLCAFKLWTDVSCFGCKLALRLV